MLAAMRALTVLLLVIAAASCGSSSPTQDAAATADVSVSGMADAGAPSAEVQAPAADLAAVGPDATPGAMIDPVLGERARAIAAEYVGYGRVDDELRWAPFLCRIPRPGLAYVSASMDGETHGQKLYSVFARNHKAYPAGPHTDQVVVKESWTIERVTDPAVKYDPDAYRGNPDAGFKGDHFYPYAMKDGVLYRAAAKAGLYIMFKLDAATPNTDAGWVYATITAAGELTAAGKVKSCVACHQDADNDRLFGVEKSVTAGP